jgi:hypothetical protein
MKFQIGDRVRFWTYEEFYTYQKSIGNTQIQSKDSYTNWGETGTIVGTFDTTSGQVLWQFKPDNGANVKGVGDSALKRIPFDPNEEELDQAISRWWSFLQ